MDYNVGGKKFTTDGCYDEVTFDVLLGQTLDAIVVNSDYNAHFNDNYVIFIGNRGAYIMHHVQECCEDVRINEIHGDIKDLVGSPILLATMTSNKDPEHPETGTWTFYNLSTIKGSVTIRWIGEATYYSEEVSFYPLKEVKS